VPAAFSIKGWVPAAFPSPQNNVLLCSRPPFQCPVPFRRAFDSLSIMPPCLQYLSAFEI
jgi:hypothetical protein